MSTGSAVNVDWQALAQEQRLTIRSARPLGEGWEFRACLVNDELVFRFPKHSAQWNPLEREVAFLAWAADRLPLQVPRYTSVVRASRAAPRGYAVYPYLPGRMLDVQALTRSQQAAAAGDVADFLRTLHALQPPLELDRLLPPDDLDTVARDLHARALRDIAPHLTSAQARALDAMFTAYLDDPANFTYTPVILHADLSCDHLLVHDGALHAVIDWSDVGRGDPDNEFSYLYTELGWAFTE